MGVRYASTNPILDRLVRAGILLRLRRDRYALAEQAGTQTRKIANELIKPSALSLWTALSDAGLTTQVPRIVQSVTSKRSVQIERGTVEKLSSVMRSPAYRQAGSVEPSLPSFQYVHLPDTLFFGMQLDAAGIFRMPPEKALLDLLFVQRGKVDMDSVDVARLDRPLLLRFADRFPPYVQSAL